MTSQVVHLVADAPEGVPGAEVTVSSQRARDLVAAGVARRVVVEVPVVAEVPVAATVRDPAAEVRPVARRGDVRGR